MYVTVQIGDRFDDGSDCPPCDVVHVYITFMVSRP